jgi:hypothetical protein
MKYGLIPKSTSVDNVTINENVSGEIQIKDGAVSIDILETSVANSIGVVLLDQTISADTSYSLGSGYTRLEVSGTNCGYIHINGKTSGYTGAHSTGGTNTTHFEIGVNGGTTDIFMANIIIVSGKILCTGIDHNPSVSSVYAGSVGTSETELTSIEFEYSSSGKVKIIGYKD